MAPTTTDLTFRITPLGRATTHSDGYPSILIGVVHCPVGPHPAPVGVERQGAMSGEAARLGTLVAGVLAARRGMGAPGICPSYVAVRARPDRGSPMFEQPDEDAVYGRRPSQCYRHIYPPSHDLNRVSYFVEHDTEHGPPANSYGKCTSLVTDWKRKWGSKSRHYLRMVRIWESVTAELDRPVDWLRRALRRLVDPDLVIGRDGTYLALTLPAKPDH